jgi:hypothetical protein
MNFTKIYGLVKSPKDISVVNYNFLWSDKSAGPFPSHSDSDGYSTNDWYNGFRISNTHVSSQSTTAK